MRLYGLLCAALLPVTVCLSCNKLIGDLIPSNEQKLISFDLKNVERFVCSTNTAIREHAVTVTVPKGTDVTRLLPESVVSAQATLFPVTLRYLQEAFPATDVLKIGSAIGSFENIEAINKWFFEMYAENPNFTIPELIFPINFLSPVPFAVIGGQGKIELYTVKVLYDDGTDPATGTLPPGVNAEKNILSFTVGEPQIGESVIGESTVDFEVKAGTEVRALTVTATVSPHAVLIPLTESYLVPLLQSLGMDPLSVLSGYITAPNKEAYLRALFAPVNLSTVIVPLNKPIDFTNPVQFAVLGNDKDVKLYTATCKQTVTGAALKNFGFSKVKNPGLVKDGTVRIDHAAKTVTAELFYPVEYSNTGYDAFSLYCDVAYAGDEVEIKYRGRRYETNDKIRFRPENPSGAQYHLGTAEAKIIITFGTEQMEYRLFISFKEDPDTSRSITDFRFTKDKNASIKTLSMAAIANDGHEGTITATVLYTGSAKPESLIPTFITPGTVTVNGAAQTSGSSAQDFRKTLTYLCTSRNGQYTRRYTVKIRFVYAEPAQSLLKTFRFPAGVNPLTKDSEGRIDQTAHTVHISACYAGERPKKLIPEFSATGEVTVDGLTQSSGFSAQDFEYPVYYKVTDPDDPQTYTIYAVTVHFEYSADSGCELTEFKLLMQDNPSLTQDVTAFISAHSGGIYALLPRGADVTNLIPRFTARGRVTVDGVEQTSGETAADFSSVVEYKVTSENGLHTKIYRVTLQQAGGIIYVDPKATGRNNGSTWEDAFTNLEAALHKANEIPAEVSAEIWLSKDCKTVYRDYELKRTLTLRGGFIGIERDADERNKDNKSLFYRVLFHSQTPIGGTLMFDGIKFDPYYSADNKKILHNIQWDTACENALVIQNCTLALNLDVSTSARLASVTVKDVVSEGSFGSDLTLPDCDTAAVDNFIGGILFINKDGGIAPAQKTVVKNSTCSNSIRAKDISVSHSNERYGWFYNFDTISLSSITDDTSVINLSPVASASVEIEECRIGSIIIRNTQNGVLKLKKVNITDSTVKNVNTEPSVITERFLSWRNYAMSTLKLPACSVTMKNYTCRDTIDVSCNEKDFKAIMEAIPVHTDIENVTAKTIKCGYVTGVTEEHFRTIKREYNCPPYVFKEGDWEKIYVEPVPFASGGSHTLKDVKAENLYVSSGDSITLKDSDGYRAFWLHGQLKGSLSFFGRNNGDGKNVTVYNAVDFSSVVLNNETTPNSKIDIDNIYVQGEWFRARTNTLSVRNITKGFPIGCIELQGHSGVTVTDCDFRNLVPFYAYWDNKPTIIRPSFLAVGGTVSLTNCTFDESFVQVGSGTCFDAHLNSTFNCTVAVWKK
jgi:hemagglutinin-related protein